MELLLVRHAQTHSNVVRALDTAHPGADLTELGEQQVAELGRLLADEEIGAVHVSRRLRTRRTASALSDPRGLEQVLHEGLVEVAAGDLEMSTVEADADLYNRTVSAWVHGDLAARIPGGEDGHEAIGRMDEVVARVVAEGEESGHRRAALVSHGALLRAWSGVRCVNVGPALAVEHPLRNTGVVRVDVTGGRATALVWDEQAVATGGEAGAAADVPDDQSDERAGSAR